MGLSDIVHGVLDVAGFIPVVGAAADIANAAVYAAEGDWGNAALSAVSAIPVVGDAAAVAGKSVKVIAKVSKASEKALSKAKKMKSLFGAMKGKAKTGAKNLLNKINRKLKARKQKRAAKKVCTNGKCFTGDTLVYTIHGLRPIKEIKKGDDIYSRNVQTGETAVRKVEEVFQTEAHTIYHIWLDGKEELKMTAYHPVFVKEQGWITAIKLREGNVLETLEGKAQVTRIEKVRHEEPVEVFNFHVEEWESYFASERQVYVHNGHGHIHDADSLELKAEKARDALIQDTPGGDRKAMAIGAYDVKTGDVAADFAGPVPENISPVLRDRAAKIGGIGSKGLTDRNIVGVCAEFRAANQLLLKGSDIRNIRFTNPVRPRNGQVMPNCANCLEMFSDIL